MFSNNTHTSSLLRVLDANLNRLREGVRVVEDISRYTYNNKDITYKLKDMRHRARLDYFEEILYERDASNDVAKDSTTSEISRDGISSLLHANFCRICESARVLEECLKLEECCKYGRSSVFKQIRYEAYELHKMLCSLAH